MRICESRLRKLALRRSVMVKGSSWVVWWKVGETGISGQYLNLRAERLILGN